MPPVKGKIRSFRDPKSHRDPEPILFPRIQADSGSSEQLDDSNLRDNVAKFLDIRELYSNQGSNKSSKIGAAKP